jgi:site-specific recombinase XerD
MLNDASERTVNEIANGLLDDFTPEQIRKIQNRIWIVLSNKTITEDTYEITEYEESNNVKFLKEFYCSKKLEGCSNKSLYQYVNQNRKFLDYIGLDVNQIKTKHVRAYLAYYQTQSEELNGKPLSNVTVKNTTRYLCTFFNWLEDEEYIDKNPVRKIKATKCSKMIRK